MEATVVQNTVLLIYKFKLKMIGQNNKVGSGLTIQTHRDKTDGLPKLLIFTYSTLQ